MKTEPELRKWLTAINRYIADVEAGTDDSAGPVCSAPMWVMVTTLQGLLQHILDDPSAQPEFITLIDSLMLCHNEIVLSEG